MVENLKNELMETSKKIWNLFIEGKVDESEELIHDNAMFIHMGTTFDKKGEYEAIKSKLIVLKKLEVEETTVYITENTGIILNKIKLTVEVKGEEVTNPFVVTEVYNKNKKENWLLLSMSYTRIVY